MSNKSLLVVTTTFPRWKNDTTPPFVFELCRRLKNQGFEIDVLAPHCNKASKHEKLDGINVYRHQYFFSKLESLAYGGGIPSNLNNNKWLYCLLPFFIMSQFIAICLQLHNKNYDVVHAHWLIPNGLLCLLAAKILSKKIKIVGTSHGSDLFSFKSFPAVLIKKWVLKNLDGLTVVSQHMQRECSDVLKIDRDIFVCPMGVDLKQVFIPVPDIKKNENKIIFVGRLIEHKGVIFLLDAIKIIAQTIPGVRLVIVGDGPDREFLERRSKSIGIENLVEFNGPVAHDKLPELLSSASIAVVPSIKEEGLGLVAIEAMGCGCAVIMSAIKAAEQFIDNDVNGILVTPCDSSALAKSITSLLMDKDKCNQMAKDGRQSVIDKYDWEVIAPKYAEILKLYSR